MREVKGLTQGQVAEALGMYKGSYSNYETGKREPDIHMLKKIAYFFGTSMDDLMSGKIET